MICFRTCIVLVKTIVSPHTQVPSQYEEGRTGTKEVVCAREDVVMCV